MAITDNIISYYKFDNNATDEVGAHNATLHGCTYTGSGKINGCYSFNGTTDDIETGIVIAKNTAYSISMWVYFSSSGGGNDYFICNDLGSSGNSGMYAYYNHSSQAITVAVTDGLSHNCFTPITISSVSKDTFHHFVITWDGSTTTGSFKVYLNTSVTSCGAFSYAMSDDITTSFILGQYAAAATAEGLLGRIDEVGFWSRAITSSEVSTIYNSGTGLTYPFSTETIPTDPTGLTVTPTTAYSNSLLTATGSGSDSNYRYMFENYTDSVILQDYSDTNTYQLTTALSGHTIRIYVKGWNGTNYSTNAYTVDRTVYQFYQKIIFH